MNYFEKHIGDYLKDTSHLSLLEHGVYNRLFDVYYTREGGIPDDQAARLIGARSKDERAALTSVLAEFFTLVDGVWTQVRCDAEIDRFKDKQRKAKASADARWAHIERNANASPNAMRTHSEGNAPRARPQTPDTRHQEEKENPPAARVPPAAAGPRPTKNCPESFVVTPELQAWAMAETPAVNIEIETAKLRDHTFATARKDWPGTWRNWMRKAAERAAPSSQTQSFYERDQQAKQARAHALTGGIMGAKVTDAFDFIDMETPDAKRLR